MGPSGWDEGRKFQLTYLLASVPAFCAVGCCPPDSAATCACARAVELGCNRGNTRRPLGELAMTDDCDRKDVFSFP